MLKRDGRASLQTMLSVPEKYPSVSASPPPPPPQYVILCDVRDTYFQSNPTNVMLSKVSLKQLAKIPVSFFSEGKPVSESRCNTRWIEECCSFYRGTRVPWHSHILNGGLVSGGRDSMIDVLEEMLGATALMKHVRGLDQAILTYWRNVEGGFRQTKVIEPTDAGCLGAVVGMAPKLFIGFPALDSRENDVSSHDVSDTDLHAKVVSFDGKIIPILHQYDRRPLLDHLIERQYSALLQTEQHHGRAETGTMQLCRK